MHLSAQEPLRLGVNISAVLHASLMAFFLLLVDETGTTNCRARQKLKERVPLLLSDVGYCHLLHRLVLIFLMYLLITVIH